MATKQRKHKGRKGLGVMSNSGRKVNATTRVSIRSQFSAPQNVLATPYSQDQYKTYGNLNKSLGSYDANGHLVVGGWPGADEEADRRIAGVDRAQTPAARWGKVCAGCHVQLARHGQCFDCN